MIETSITIEEFNKSMIELNIINKKIIDDITIHYDSHNTFIYYNNKIYQYFIRRDFCKFDVDFVAYKMVKWDINNVRFCNYHCWISSDRNILNLLKETFNNYIDAGNFVYSIAFKV